MSAEIKAFAVVKGDSSKPDPGVVESLEGLLARAKAGELRAFAYATAAAGNTIGTGWDGSGQHRIELAAAVAMLATRYPMALIEEDT